MALFLWPCMKYAFMTKLGGDGDRFGDNLCVDCANFPCVSGSSHFKNTNFARPINKMLKSKVETGW